MALHLYGVVRADRVLDDGLEGVRRAPVGLVPSGDVAVAVSAVDASTDEIELTDEDAVRHLEVLQTLLEVGPVLPLRLGTVAPDEQSVRDEVLGPALGDLSRHLDALDGLVEVHVDVTDDEDARVREVVAADPGLRPAGGGRGTTVQDQMGLGELVASRVADLRAADAEQVVSRLRTVARDDAPREAGDGWVTRWSFLLRAEDVPMLDDLLATLHDEHGGSLRFTRVGPLPVFGFTVLPEAGRSESRWGW